jgi:hypothetical protein
MLKFVYKKVALQWVILFGLLAIALFTIITKTNVSHEEGSAFLFIGFTNFFSQHEFLGKGIIIITLLLHLVFIQYYYIKNEYAKNSLLPACYYLSILLLTNSLTIISPLFFTLLFFIIIISINYTENLINIKNNLFWIGLIIAFATCFDQSSVVLLLLVIITLIINQYSRLIEIAILLLGFFLIYFYFFSYYFFVDQLKEWISTFQQMRFLGLLNSTIPNPLLMFISLVGLGLIYIYFIVRFKLSSDAKVMIQRKKILTLNTRAVLMIVCLFISNTTYPGILGYIFVHLSIYLALLAQEKSPLFSNEVVTILTFVLLWL